ncbi:uncharacterized protein LOC101859807 isoform X2 [Aplysia californica]|uniref:Uncharacterized protein LOC101859807 isoform X2 n=1 Tax=Aplysia californica TaxID=6500 RepID=A0ABM0K0C7_APLCA|nr:uncharacterized protein LOC101859807 isoform X2 [Aplysia californica]
MRRKSSNTHISLAVIKQYLLCGTYPSGSTPTDKRSVRKRSESFKIEDGELHYIVRPKRLEGEPPDPNPGSDKANLRRAVITPKTQFSVVSQMHVTAEGVHMGTERTLNALSSKYYWVGMASTVRKVLKNCVVCLANRPAVSNFQQSHFSEVVPAVEPEIPTTSCGSATGGEKKELQDKLAPVTAKQEDVSTEMQYIVTAELHEPETVDSDLDFDPSSVVTDSVFDPRVDFDVARRFWQKVEVQIIGPLQYKKRKKTYVAAALDGFSKWPEVHVLEKLNEKYVSQFLLRLIARYGVMEEVILLANDLLQDQSLDSGGIAQNLQHYAVAVSLEKYNPVDEHWSHLLQLVQSFSEQYTDSWHTCLDLCLIPARNSLTAASDFSPAYLLMNREPSFPASILPPKDSSNGEISLTTAQTEQCVEAAMSDYLQCCVPDIKQVITLASVNDLSESVPQRRSGRKPKKSHRTAGGGSEDNGALSEDGAHEGCNSVRGPKRKSWLSVSNPRVGQPAARNEKTATLENVKESSDLDKNAFSEDDIEVEMELDTYYSAIWLYKATAQYPPNSHNTFKRSMRKVCEHHVLEEGELFYVFRGKQLKVVTTMEDRLALLADAHVVDGEHLSRLSVNGKLEKQQVHWKGMMSDVEAYIRACPECKHGIPRKNHRRMSSRARSLLRRADANSDDEDMEAADIGKVSYRELIDFLRKDIIPDDLSRSELLIFRKKAKHYKVERGILYFIPPHKPDEKPKKVLRTQEERVAAVKAALGDHTCSQSEVLAAIRRWAFWPDMPKDVEQELSKWCNHQSKANAEKLAEEAERRQMMKDWRLKRFQDYFAGKDICSKRENLDTLFPPLAEPAKEETSPPAKPDLVAKAMESAMLSSSPPESGAGTDVNAEVMEEGSEVESTVMIDVAGDGTVVVNTGLKGQDKEMTSTSTDVQQSTTEPSAVQGQVPKLEISESASDKNAVIEEELEDEEEHVGEMEEVEDGDPEESWSLKTADMLERIQVSQTVEESSPVKKIGKRRRCEVCQEIVRGENNYKEHMYRHTGIKPFSCSNCPKKFTTKKGLRMHLRRHTGHRPYLCNICGRGFPRSASLRYHIKTHDKGGGVPVVCDICHRTFTTENRLQKHKRFKHPAQAPVFCCEQCGKTFTAKRSLKRHEEAHQGIRKYVCQYCKRSFFRKEYLNYHLVSHSNEDPSLASYKLKGRHRKQQQAAARKREYVSIVCVDSTGAETGQNEEVYGQLVEVTDPSEWSQVSGRIEEQRVPTVFGLEGGQRVLSSADQAVEGTSVVMVEEQPNGQGEVEVRHIIMPGGHIHEQSQQLHRKPQTITVQHTGGVSSASHVRSMDGVMNAIVRPGEQQQAQSIEVVLPSGAHTFTVPCSRDQLTDTGQETVQYQVECLSGETLTEADVNAIRMLAHASLSGTHIVQQ